MSEKKSLESQLKEWLETQGYPLEMEVAQEFREHGFSVGQGSYYYDPDTKEPREIDVVASQADFIDNLQVFLTCFVSCKSSRDKPWVLFTTATSPQDGNAHLYGMVASRLGMQLIHTLKRPQYEPLPHALAPRERIAYGVTVAFRARDANDIAYEAVMSAAKAAISRATTVTELEPEEAIVEIMVPVVLLDGFLFEYYLDGAGEKQLRKTNWGLLSLRNPIPGRNLPTLVHVITKEGLAEFVMSLGELFSHWQVGTKEQHDKLVQSWEKTQKPQEITFLPFGTQPA
jgi:hypothetical protein